MPRATDRQAILYENLCDAGCAPPLIASCIACVSNNKSAELLQLLASKRSELLDTLHENQKQLDCLDYLVYQIKRGNVI